MRPGRHSGWVTGGLGNGRWKRKSDDRKAQAAENSPAQTKLEDWVVWVGAENGKRRRKNGGNGGGSREAWPA